MAKLIFHTKPDLEAIAERRLRENLELTPNERMKKAYMLMAISARFKKEKGPLREPQGLGIVLKKK